MVVVAPNGKHRSDLAESVQYALLANVPRVNDEIGAMQRNNGLRSQ